jgi:uncharacterized protein
MATRAAGNMGYTLAILAGAHAAASHGGILWLVAAALLAIAAAVALDLRQALGAGALAGAIGAAPIVAHAFAYAPLSFSESIAVALTLAIWAAGMALVAVTWRWFAPGAIVSALVVIPLFASSVPSLAHKLDNVTWRSLYLTMSDGTKIATDVYLPRGVHRGERLPAVLRQIRYYRAIAIRWPFNIWADERAPILERVVADNRYAAVVTDVRGSGASFGHREQEWSPREVRDGSEIVDWIVAQPWSNGKIGTVGGSYDGTAASFLIAAGNPAVKAGILMFCLFDAYTDVSFPGGVNLRWFTDNWGKSLHVLDSNTMGDYLHGRLVKFAFLGVKPVDADAAEVQLRAAIAEHRKNYDASAFARDVAFRDEPWRDGLRMDRLSPLSLIAAERRLRVPIYNVSGWFDGAYQHAAVKRFVNAPFPGNRLLIGPWDHGARNQIDPYHKGEAFDLPAEMLRFFDYYLKGKANGIEAQPPVRYYTMAEGRWHFANTWPPSGDDDRALYFGPQRTLTTAPHASGADLYRVDLTATTGIYARWNSLSSAGTGRTGYFDRNAQDKKLLVYQTPPLKAGATVTGNPVITLRVRSSAPDTQFFAYLEDVNPNGHVDYVTEGQLRSIHRRITSTPLYADVIPQHSYKRADSSPLPVNEAVTVTFDLLPTSWLFRAGHSIRIALAGADANHFVLPPTAATWHIYYGPNGSKISLPITSQ